MVSFPIPEPYRKAEKSTNTKLDSIHFGEENLGELAKEVYSKDLSKDNLHLDPDLHHSARPDRHPKWKGAFGQAQSSLGHLKNFDVGEGDLFLFFGNFIHYKDCNRSNSFAKDALPFHALFGYLHVGEVLKVDGKEDQSELEEIYKDHPHIRYRDYYKSKAKQKKGGYSNAIFIASDELAKGIPGWGTFTYDESLRLSAPGYNKSVWKLPACFRYNKNRPITYNENKKNFCNLSDDEVLLKTAGRGQEFVIKDPSREMVDWAMELISDHRTR